MSDYAALMDRVAATSPELEPAERAAAESVVEACRELHARPRSDGRLIPAANDMDLRRALGRMMETLGRRSSRALPAAALARAALADLGGDVAGFRAACADCHAKLGLFGW